MKPSPRTCLLPAAVGGLVLTLSTALQAESLSELIPQLLKTNNLIEASKAAVTAANQQIRVSKGGWFPTLGVTSTYGHEKQKKPEGTDDTDFVSRGADLSVTQLLWDFGNVNSQIRASKIGLTRAEADLEFRRQEVSDLKSKREYSCIVTNPPYGERLGETDEVEAVYRELGRVFAPLSTWSIYVLTSNRWFEKHYGCRASRRRKLYNGRLECQYYQYPGPRPPDPQSFE